MELRQLRYFAAVAAHGSFSRAAGSLHLTQPAVSRQIKSLEEELGVTLLRRGTNTVALTAAGEQFYEEARDLLARADEAVRRVRRQTRAETLRIGYVASLAAGLLPGAIKRFQAVYPQVRLELFDLTPQTLSEKAANRLLDVAVLPRGLEAVLPEFEWVELRSLTPVLVLPRSHPFARRKKIHPAQLREQPLHGLGRTHFPEYAPRLREILKPFGVKPVSATQGAESIATLFAALEADGGIVVLNEGILDMLPPSLVSRPFSPALAPLVVVAGLPASQPNPHAEAFVQRLREEADRLPPTKTSQQSSAQGRSSTGTSTKVWGNTSRAV